MSAFEKWVARPFKFRTEPGVTLAESEQFAGEAALSVAAAPSGGEISGWAMLTCKAGNGGLFGSWTPPDRVLARVRLNPGDVRRLRDELDAIVEQQEVTGWVGK